MTFEARTKAPTYPDARPQRAPRTPTTSSTDGAPEPDAMDSIGFLNVSAADAGPTVSTRSFSVSTSFSRLITRLTSETSAISAGKTDSTA